MHSFLLTDKMRSRQLFFRKHVYEQDQERDIGESMYEEDNDIENLLEER